ncbi:MAG: cysteine hydrolase [Bryobacterales bacterium]|nr:cysteine hydrolase [Bryobacterales bacterium]
MSLLFLDIDTQLDFLFPAGALYVPGAGRILDNLARLNRHAAARGVPLLSTTDAHTEDDPEFRSWPPHCIAGALGQRKPEATLVRGHAVLPANAIATVRAPQVIVEKRTFDCFTNPMLEPLLDELGITEAAVYGVVTEICVADAVRGLHRTGRRVTLVQDAVMCLDAAKARALEAEVTAAGGALTTASQLCD